MKTPIEQLIDAAKEDTKLDKSKLARDITHSDPFEQDYRQYLQGKRVAIIGPAPSIYDLEEGERIDKEYDVVIRVNKQWDVPEPLHKFVGKRVDVLYNCLNPSPECGGKIDFDTLKRNKCKFIVNPIPLMHNRKKHRDSMFHKNQVLNHYIEFHCRNYNRFKFISGNREWYNNLDKQLQTRMNTGFGAIMHLLQYDIKELYVKGFTFFLDGYVNSYRDVVDGQKVKEDQSSNAVIKYMGRTGNHQQLPQFKWLQQVWRKDKRIVPDPKLKQILELKTLPGIY